MWRNAFVVARVAGTAAGTASAADVDMNGDLDCARVVVADAGCLVPSSTDSPLHPHSALSGSVECLLEAAVARPHFLAGCPRCRSFLHREDGRGGLTFEAGYEDCLQLARGRHAENTRTAIFFWLAAI